jgi:hypothetical protein
MNDGAHPIVPRATAENAVRPSPLDPYVRNLLTWINKHDRKLSPKTLAKQAAAALDWPLPFAEAIVTATRSRRLVTLAHVSARRQTVTLTRRGREWLERSPAAPEVVKSAPAS